MAVSAIRDGFTVSSPNERLRLPYQQVPGGLFFLASAVVFMVLIAE